MIKINEDNQTTTRKLKVNDENPETESFNSNISLKDQLEVVKTEK